eukprot:SAG25_NODE_1637_length_2642_cov_3.620134_2_plen_72_part_00
MVCAEAQTEEVGGLLDRVSALLSAQHAPKRSCHVCEAEIEPNTNSRCTGCQVRAAFVLCALGLFVARPLER